VGDIPKIVAVMKEDEHVQFLDWECELLAHTESCNGIVLVAVDDRDSIVGAVIGGAMGFRGTINHLAVSREARGAGVGRALFQAIKQRFAEMRIYRLFLFVQEGAQGADAFWQSQGFRRTKNETTYEIDIV
jgi:ribosomal protein S18 acetylase RimI-like enzyme